MILILRKFVVIVFCHISDAFFYLFPVILGKVALWMTCSLHLFYINMNIFGAQKVFLRLKPHSPCRPSGSLSNSAMVSRFAIEKWSVHVHRSVLPIPFCMENRTHCLSERDASGPLSVLVCSHLFSSLNYNFLSI